MHSRALTWSVDWLTARGESVRTPDVPFTDRPWATVFRIDSNLSRYYLKIPAPASAIESALHIMLTGRMGAPVVEVLARHPGSGAFLLSDAGEQLGVAFKEDGNLAPLLPLFPRYADAQIKAPSLVPDLLALGLPDWSLRRIPDLFGELLASSLADESGLSSLELRQIAGRQGLLPNLCAQLDDIGLPPTLDHGDFGDGNIFVRNGNALIADWGETVIGHPFLSVVNFAHNFKRRHGERGAVCLSAAIWEYLERWRGRASKPAAGRASRLGAGDGHGGASLPDPVCPWLSPRVDRVRAGQNGSGPRLEWPWATFLVSR